MPCPNPSSYSGSMGGETCFSEVMSLLFSATIVSCSILTAKVTAMRQRAQSVCGCGHLGRLLQWPPCATDKSNGWPMQSFL